MKIIESILTKNSCYTAGKKITVKGLMLHSVGCPQPSATVFTEQWNKPGVEKCVHAFIDGNTGDIYQTLPWNHRGWHCGGAGNNTHIGVEMCEPDCIKYTTGSSFTCSDVSAAKIVVKRTYEAAVELFANLCKQFNLDPLADGVIMTHKEGHAKGIASNHGDPEHLWKGLGMNYTLEGFRKDVSSAMGKVSTEAEKGHINENMSSQTIYKVQVGAFKVKTNALSLQAELKAKGFDTFLIHSNGYWKVQVGAYSKKSNAENMLAKVKKSGYNGFITNTGNTTTKKSSEAIAKEVLAGKWGNGSERKRRLMQAGYDYEEIQKIVNKIS